MEPLVSPVSDENREEAQMTRWWLLLACLLVTSEPGATEIRQCTYPDGTVEWRGRPCPPGSGIQSKEHEPGDGRGTFNTIPADQPPETLMKRAELSRARTLHRSQKAGPAAGAAREDAELRCAEYEKRIDAIEYRLRKGYTVTEGNELRAERRRIKRLQWRACR